MVENYVERNDLALMLKIKQNSMYMPIKQNNKNTLYFFFKQK